MEGMAENRSGVWRMQDKVSIMYLPDKQEPLGGMGTERQLTRAWAWRQRLLMLLCSSVCVTEGPGEGEAHEASSQLRLELRNESNPRWQRRASNKGAWEER